MGYLLLLWVGLVPAAAVVVLAAAGAAGTAAYADDLYVESRCIQDYLFISIYDAEDNGAISGASVRTVPDLLALSVVSQFETDANGQFALAPEHNTGWIWLSSPGYNDRRMSSTCSPGGGIDGGGGVSPSPDYCYAYVYDRMPMTYLPELDSSRSHATVDSLLDFLISKIDDKDRIIYEQVQVLLRAEHHVQPYNGPALAEHTPPDRLCLDAINNANSLLLEALGIVFVTELGVLGQDEIGRMYDEILYRLADMSALEYCDAVDHTSGLADEIVAASDMNGLLASQWTYVEAQTPGFYYGDGSGSDDRYYYDDANDRLYHYDDANDLHYYYDDANDRHDCYMFCDSDDYEPGWARYLDYDGALEACWDVEANPERIGTDDWYWCKELERHLSGGS